MFPIHNARLIRESLFNPEVPPFKANDPSAKPVRQIYAGFDKAQLDEVRSKVLSETGLSSLKGIQAPWKDGDETDPETGERVKPEYASGLMLFRASTTFELAQSNMIVGRDRKPMRQEHLVPGWIYTVLVQPKAWTYAGRQGISLYLSGIWLTKTADKFEVGGGNVAAAFEAAEAGAQFGEMPSDIESGFDL